MTTYVARFFKTLLSSDGHPFEVLQRVVRVNQTDNVEDAIRIAEKSFEAAEHVGDWQLHADRVEISVGKRALGVTEVEWAELSVMPRSRRVIRKDAA